MLCANSKWQYYISNMYIFPSVEAQCIYRKVLSKRPGRLIIQQQKSVDGRLLGISIRLLTAS